MPAAHQNNAYAVHWAAEVALKRATTSVHAMHMLEQQVCNAYSVIFCVPTIKNRVTVSESRELQVGELALLGTQTAIHRCRAKTDWCEDCIKCTSQCIVRQSAAT